VSRIETGEWSEDQEGIELQESERLRIFHGEPRVILPLLKSDSIDLYFTDPGPIPGDICDELYRLLGKDTGVYLDANMGEGALAIKTLQESKRYIGIEPDDEKWKKACERIRKYANPKPAKKTVTTKGGSTFSMLFGPPKSP